MSYKACTKCKELKQLRQFAVHAKSRDGRKNACRKCHGFKKGKVKSVRERVREYFDAKV